MYRYIYICIHNLLSLGYVFLIILKKLKRNQIKYHKCNNYKQTYIFIMENLKNLTMNYN
jgi:hypothetical protein